MTSPKETSEKVSDVRPKSIDKLLGIHGSFFDAFRVALIIILVSLMVLMTFGIGMIIGISEESVLIIDQTQKDIWIVEKGDLHIFNRSTINEDLIEEIERTNGVKQAFHLIYQKMEVRKGNRTADVMVVGLNTTSGVGAPWNFRGGYPNSLNAPNTIFVDESLMESLGELVYTSGLSIRNNSLLSMGNETLEIGGIVRDAKFFDLPYIFMSHETAAQFISREENKTSFILVEADPDKDIYVLSRELSKIEGVDAFVSSELRENTINHGVHESQIAGAIGVVIFLDLVLALFLILLMGFNEIIDRLPELGLKSKEVVNSELLKGIYELIILNVSLGFTIGLIVYYTISIIVSNFLLLPLEITFIALILEYLLILLVFFAVCCIFMYKTYLKNNWKHLLINVIAIIFLIVLWYLLVTAADGGNQFLQENHIHELPTPGETWDAFVESLTPSGENELRYRPSIFQHAWASIVRVIIGFFLAALVGIPTGLVMGRYRYASDFGSPIVELIRPIPPLAWIGVGLLVFVHNVGYFIVFIGCVFPLILSTVSGVKAVDEGLIEASKTLGANNFQILGKVVIPGALPSIITGMRIGLGIGWMSIVAAEMVGLQEGLGLGYYLWVNYDSYGFYDHMVVGMLFIGLIGWIMNMIIQRAEKRMIRWKE
jgi:NitT/TauT family transport system permease protein